jgi:hypothetical protein
MADGNAAQLADSLWQAETGRAPISPITDAHPGLAEFAYLGVVTARFGYGAGPA